MYKQFVKPFLFCFRAEKAQKIYLSLLRFSGHFPRRYLVRLLHIYEDPSLEREVFGLNFPNPVGLAAGFDSNGDCINDLANFGFGFMEIGSLSTLGQQVDQKHNHVVRVKKRKALVNHGEGSNKGVSYAIARIQERRPDTIICANITYNSASHKDEEIINDYQKAFSLLYDFVDMITVNVSRPNDDGLLEVQDISSLQDIMDPILDLRLCYDQYKPILIKISPDTPLDQLDGMLDYCMLSGVDGIVAGDTTRHVEDLEKNGIKEGYMSGAPLFERSLAVVKHISEHTKGRFPIIGCGGITTPQQAAKMLSAGASLIQVHTGLVYEGPKLVKKILKYLVNDNS